MTKKRFLFALLFSAFAADPARAQAPVSTESDCATAIDAVVSLTLIAYRPLLAGLRPSYADAMAYRIRQADLLAGSIRVRWRPRAQGNLTRNGLDAILSYLVAGGRRGGQSVQALDIQSDFYDGVLDYATTWRDDVCRAATPAASPGAATAVAVRPDDCMAATKFAVGIDMLAAAPGRQGSQTEALRFFGYRNLQAGVLADSIRVQWPARPQGSLLQARFDDILPRLVLGADPNVGGGLIAAVDGQTAFYARLATEAKTLRDDVCRLQPAPAPVAEPVRPVSSEMPPAGLMQLPY